jgi:hypothetical protein
MFASGSALIRVEAALDDQDATLIVNGYEPIVVIGTCGHRQPPVAFSLRPPTRPILLENNGNILLRSS